MFALVLQIPNENRTGFSIVHLYKRPRTENTACAKRVRPFAKIRTGESKSKLACILPGGRIFDEVKGTNNSGKAAETGPPEAFFQPNVIFSARKCAKIKNMSIFAVPKQRFGVGRTGQVLLPRPKRRGAGVVDRAALEMRCTGNCTGGSNPSLSATNAENQQIAKQTPSFAPKNVKSGVFVLFKIIQPLHNKRVAILKESDEKRLIFIYPFTLIFQDFTSS
jgi:hypothetical protein